MTPALRTLSSFRGVLGALALLMAARLGATELVTLNGPWRFQVGDDPRWADPAWNDQGWEIISLTPAQGAHDDDVGLSGYVAGWSFRGHLGYSGYAWYRIRLRVFAPALMLAGPPAVDSAYQVFADGQLLGSMGAFRGPAPTTYSIQPRVFPLPGAPGRTIVIAFRVWMGPSLAKVPGTGGIRIAPAVGTPPAILTRYREQWRQTILGYAVEVVEAAAFLGLAVLADLVARRDPARAAYRWLAAGLLLLAVQRGNQAVYFWAQVESTRAYDVLINVLVIPLALASWIFALWARPSPPRRRFLAALAVAVLFYWLLQLLQRSWVSGDWPSSARITLALAGGIIRWAFLAVFIAGVARLAARGGPSRHLAAAAFALVGVGLFAQEISKLQVPGIWFPFGVGVSRTQYAYAACDVLLAIPLVRSLRGRAV